MKTCLLLAFEDAKDINEELRKFDRIDAYGPLANTRAIRLKNLHVLKQYFWIESYHVPKEKYTMCFIRHPDIWGEPINWIRAIAAIAECVESDLRGEFWMPSEIIAFDFFLTSMMGKNIILKKVRKLHDGKHAGSNFLAEWKILKNRKEMLNFYRRHKIEILRNFYRAIGKYYWKVSFNEVERVLREKYKISIL